MDWDWAFVAEILPTLIEGVKITILVIYFALAMLISAGVRALERRLARGLDGVRS